MVASPDGADGSLRIHQDVKIYLTDLSEAQELTYNIPIRRHIWLQVLRGLVQAGGNDLETSDAIAVSEESALTLKAASHAELMLFDLA